MSTKSKAHSALRETYNSFSRNILSEVMSEKELKELDRRYNQAKIKRTLQRAGIKIEMVKEIYNLK